MALNTNFSGTIFQVIETLDWGDAVSNQVIELGAMLQRLGFSTAIHSKWYHDKVREFRADLELLQPTDRDVVILHMSGLSEHALPYVQHLQCTKICIYHNITPHTCFPPGSHLYNLCLKGRPQLEIIVRNFHYFWGDSHYNLQELIDLGAKPEQGAVVPIIVRRNPREHSPAVREPGAWIFLGRVAPSKGQINLVRLFAKVRSKDFNSARKLYVVGGYTEDDPYFEELKSEISRQGLQKDIVLTGKVSDEEVDGYLARASLYVSMSEHEGFGVPLIEAANFALPVVALRNTAIGETMGECAGLANSSDELQQLIVEAFNNTDFYSRILEYQKQNALRFTPEAVEARLLEALQVVLPEKTRFSTVSIVICTYNRGDHLDRCLDYLQYQSNQNFEVIVVNGPSTDNTDEVIERYRDRIKVAHNPTRNLSVSRNLGIELADGDIVAFIDDDALPFDDWVDTILEEFSSRPLTVAALGGPIYYAGTFWFQAEDMGINKFAETKLNIDRSELGKNGWVRYTTGTNSCFRQDVLRKVKGFDEQFDYFLDESELCFRIHLHNYIVAQSSDLLLRHEFAQNDYRGGKYRFNYFPICKNTAYYVAAYSGLKGKELNDYIDQRMNIERIWPLQAACKAGEITKQEYGEFVKAIKTGSRQGLIDVQKFPQTRDLNPAPMTFRTFTGPADYPLVGRDLKSLHICIITREFPAFAARGGVGTQFYHLASELLLMGHHVTIVTPGDRPPHCQGRFSVLYVKCHDICTDPLGSNSFTGNANWAISAFHAIAELHASKPVDVVEFAIWDTQALAFCLVEKGKRPPVVLRLVTPFSVAVRMNGWNVPKRESDLLMKAEETVILRADAVVANSKSTAKTIEAEFGIHPDSRWGNCYHGVAYWPSFDHRYNYSELKEVNGLTLPQNAKFLLFIGRLEGRKGLDILIRAANEILSSDPDAHLLLAGRDVDGWQERSKSIISSKLAERVHFLGEVDDVVREKLFNLAYCLLFPSRYESFGLVPLEAFVHGLPVIAARAGAIPEVVNDEACGLLFEPDDPASLAGCARRLLKERDLRDTLSRGAKRQIRDFSSRKFAIASVKIYDNLLNGREISA